MLDACNGSRCPQVLEMLNESAHWGSAGVLTTRGGGEGRERRGRLCRGEIRSARGGAQFFGDHTSRTHKGGDFNAAGELLGIGGLVLASAAVYTHNTQRVRRYGDRARGLGFGVLTLSSPVLGRRISSHATLFNCACNCSISPAATNEPNGHVCPPSGRCGISFSCDERAQWYLLAPLPPKAQRTHASR